MVFLEVLHVGVGVAVQLDLLRQKDDEQPTIQPLASDPETITDEDEDIKEIKIEEKPKNKGQQKARRGKPFQVARGNIRNLKKCTINLDRKDVEEKDTDNTQKDVEEVPEDTQKEEPTKKKITKKGKKVVEKKKTVVNKNKIIETEEMDEKIDDGKKEVEDKKTEKAEEIENIVEENVTAEESFKMETVAVYVKNVNNGGKIQDLSDSLKMTKEEQKQAVRDSVHIQKLESDIQAILENRLKVKDTKERIKRLEVILELLRRFPEGDECKSVEKNKSVQEEFTNEKDSLEKDEIDEMVVETQFDPITGVQTFVKKKSDGYVKCQKSVTFEEVRDDDNEMEERKKIKEQVNTALEVVSLGLEDTKIDKDYENFPSTQVSGEKYVAKLKEKYSVETEDISEDEDVETKVEVTKDDSEKNNESDNVEKVEKDIEKEKTESDKKSDDFTNNKQTEEVEKKDETELETEKPEADEKSDAFTNNEETEESPKEDETQVENEKPEKDEKIETDKKSDDFTNNEETEESPKEDETQVENVL